MTFGGGSSSVNTGRVLAFGQASDGEEFFLDPIVGPARFNRARLVRFRQFVRHEKAVSTQPSAFSQSKRRRLELPAPHG